MLIKLKNEWIRDNLIRSVRTVPEIEIENGVVDTVIQVDCEINEMYPSGIRRIWIKRSDNPVFESWLNSQQEVKPMARTKRSKKSQVKSA